MIVRIPIFIFLVLIMSSFFWEDEEKKLRQLHQSAEVAMQGGDFETAREAYEELIKRIDMRNPQKYRVDWPTYIDSVLRLTEAYEALGEFEEGKKALSLLLGRKPPSPLLSRVKVAQARLVAREQTPGEAYVNMKYAVSDHSLETWGSTDLSFFRALEFSLDDYYDSLIQKAKRYQVSHFYKEAIALYEEILHVPLIIKSKHLPSSVNIKKLTRSIDVMPTILSLNGWKPDEKSQQIDGRTLVGVIEGSEEDERDSFFMTTYLDRFDSDVISETFEKYAYRSGKWKLIYNKDSKNVELYDLEKDPVEANDLSKLLPEKCEQLLKTLCAEVDVKREWTDDEKAEMAKRLKDLGYL